jgi:hypothetical protein
MTIIANIKMEYNTDLFFIFIASASGRRFPPVRRAFMGIVVFIICWGTGSPVDRLSG